MFAGPRATTYKIAQNAGLVFTGAADDLPRFEVDDSKARLHVPPELAALKPDQTLELRLWQVLDHPAFYRAYPELTDFPLQLIWSERAVKYGASGSVNYEQISLTTHPLADRDDLLSALLHENQHRVQRVEGFAPGSSIEDGTTEALRDMSASFRHLYSMAKASQHPAQYETELLCRAATYCFEQHLYGDKLLFRRDPPADIPALVISSLKTEAYNIGQINYLNSSGEVEAREVQERRCLTMGQRRLMAPRIKRPLGYPGDPLGVGRGIAGPGLTIDFNTRAKGQLHRLRAHLHHLPGRLGFNG